MTNSENVLHTFVYINMHMCIYVTNIYLMYMCVKYAYLNNIYNVILHVTPIYITSLSWTPFYKIGLATKAFQVTFLTL